MDHAADSTEAIESLYPFLYAKDNDLATVLAQLRESTVEKSREITALRAAVLDRDRSKLTAGAEAMATSTGKPGKLTH